MNENNGSKRREWVKNAIIIFLVIMLLLTFFSNTIMNYSLPEVSTQRVDRGTLSEQIRGSGTVTANQTYEMKMEETRTISSVEVKVGDTVEKGQTLFKLEDSESTELDDARKELDKMKLEYNKALLANGADYSLDNLKISNKEEDIKRAKEELGKLGDSHDAYEKAKNETRECSNAVDELKDQLNALEGKDYAGIGGSSGKTVVAAKAALDKAEKSKTKSEDKLKEYESDGSSDNADSLTSQRQAIEELELQISHTSMKIAEAKSDEEREELENSLEKMQLQLKYLYEKYGNDSSKSLTYLRNKQAIDSEKKTLDIRKSELEKAQKKFDDTVAAVRTELKENLKTAEKKLDEAREKEEELKSKASKTKEEAEDDIFKMERELDEMKTTLSKQQRDDAEKAGSEALDLKAKQDAIAEQEKLIKKYEDKSVGAEIKAQVAGKITDLPKAAGEKVSNGDVIASIEMSEKGYTLEMTVTAEQARKVKIGDEAEVQYFWYGNAYAKLQSIAADTVDPAKNKKLKFEVTGDVTPGQTLQLAIGSKGQNYDTLVPYGAVRHDNNGDFVLAVKAKSTPLGNRYIAERIDVKILAEDDTTRAVSGDLSGDEFIITTATKPINPGDQVRLADK